MALSRVDETDLLLPLHEGAREEPRWDTFLRRLRQRTRADLARLTVGTNLPPPLSDLAPDRLRPSRVYAAAELDEAPPGDLRIVRVAKLGGTSAVLAIHSTDRVFSAADGALLSALAPHLAIAIAGLMREERARDRLAIAEDALARAGAGWIAFDQEARVTDFDSAAERTIRALTGTPPVLGQRLRTGDAEGERLLATLVATPEEPPRALLLSSTPRLEALLMARGGASIALIRAAISASSVRIAAIGALHGLTASEARFAALLADGASIVQTAVTLGLTIETARNYSRRIYTKTGTHGQGELVRLLLTGAAALA
ncbi:hypothetical protein F9288_07005 [Sphingomonas sp. CL5.1]|uniref:helix-turn-helix transcriptional regulator n=1 Tax=Sphingomonas sp. CL5.1 TaxID=2653203 RepID=UPI0015829FCF|nr:hypothetical protein [Sphingomonas sp. CL5.1]QKR99420.1 hypothetical protein F9288_07005 [Sphingomonas sp. CL5.1]